MSCTCIELKKSIILEIIRSEKQISVLGRLSLELNTPEYYRPFEVLYTENRALFKRALRELASLQDETYNSLIAEMEELKDYYWEKILIHILLLFVYFDIETESVPALLKQLLNSTVRKIESNSWKESARALGLFSVISWFLYNLINTSVDDTSTQLFFSEPKALKPLFKNFILLEDVTNIQMANIYNTLYNAKLVSQYPLYIKQTRSVAYIYDIHLVSSSAWQEYIFRCSPEKIRKDIIVLRTVGFERIAMLLEDIVNRLGQMTIASKDKRKNICAHIIAKYAKRIEQTKKLETPRTVINRFLCSSYEKAVQEKKQV